MTALQNRWTCLRLLPNNSISRWKSLLYTWTNLQLAEHVYIILENPVFPDAPHSIKLLQKWFIYSEFDYKGSIITADPSLKLIEEHKDAEITSSFKLNENHLKMLPQQRQNVRRTVELVSHTRATTLRRYQSE